MTQTKVIDGTNYELKTIDGLQAWVPVQNEIVTISLPREHLNFIYDALVTFLNTDGEFSEATWMNYVGDGAVMETFSDEAKKVMEKILTALYPTCIGSTLIYGQIFDFKSTDDCEKWFVKLVKEEKEGDK